MDVNQTNEEIGSLLYKIEEQFARLLQQGHQISMLETDIAIRDIQKLYERFQDLRAYAANRRVRAEEPIPPIEKLKESNKIELENVKPTPIIETKLPAEIKEEKVDVAQVETVKAETEKVIDTKSEVLSQDSSKEVESKSDLLVQEPSKEAESKPEVLESAKAEVTETKIAETPKIESAAKPSDWQRTFEAKTNIPEQVTAPKKDLLQERERDFVPTVRKIEFKPEPTIAESAKKETLFDKAASLYDKIAKPVDKSIASQASKQPISNIKAAIGINEKFTYLKELFKNNINDYNESLEKLNNFDNYTAAEDYFQELKTKFNWDPDSKSFQGLADLMARRYL